MVRDQTSETASRPDLSNSRNKSENATSDLLNIGRDQGAFARGPSERHNHTMFDAVWTYRMQDRHLALTQNKTPTSAYAGRQTSRLVPARVAAKLVCGCARLCGS